YVRTGCLSLMSFALFYIMASWLFLRFLPVRISFSKQIETHKGEEQVHDVFTIVKEQNTRGIKIRVQDLRLWIEKCVFLKRYRLHILQGISADFEPGKLNVIMWPSGTSSVFT